VAVAAAFLAAVAVAAPVPAAAASHPESTTLERPATRVDRVRIRVLDKVEAHPVVMTVPLGVTVPLPDTVHSIRVSRFTRDFTLDRMPPAGPTASGETAEDEGPEPTRPESGGEAESAGKPQVPPVPRADGEGNPAAFLEVLRDGEPVAESWVFARAPYLFQPPNMRYTFALLGAAPPAGKASGESKRRP